MFARAGIPWPSSSSATRTAATTRMKPWTARTSRLASTCLPAPCIDCHEPGHYEVYAVKYATRDGTRSANFIGGDPHDGPMPMDYFVWLIRNAGRVTFVVDTGFSRGGGAAAQAHVPARARARDWPCWASSAATVKDVIITPHALRPRRHVPRFSGGALPSAGRGDELRDRPLHAPSALQHGYEVDDVVGMVQPRLQGPRPLPLRRSPNSRRA